MGDADWSTWCKVWPDIPDCANVDTSGPISGVPDFCDPLPDDIERCMVACTPDITKCDWTGKWDEFKGNWEDACKAIPTENWKYIDQCKNGGKDNAAPSAGGLVMMATMQGVVGALLLTA